MLEHAYAVSQPEEWAFQMDRYSHTAVIAKKYTVSAFLAETMGNLARNGYLVLHMGPATGRWSYNGTTSYWALAPAPDWDQRLFWADSGLTVDYVPGQTEHP